MRVIDLAIKDLRQVFKDPMSALFLLAMPLVFTAFMGMAFSPENVGTTDDNRLKVGIVDQDVSAASGSALGGYLTELLELSTTVRPVAVEMADQAEMEQAVADGDLAGVLVLPAGIATGWAAGEPALTVALIVNPNVEAGRTAQSAAQAAVQRLQSATQAARIAAGSYAQAQPTATDGAVEAFYADALGAAVAAWDDAPLSVSVESATRDGAGEPVQIASGFDQSSPGMLVQFAMFGLIGAASTLVLERQSGTLQRLLTTTLSKAQTIGGHTLAMFVVILLEQTMCVLAGQFLFGVDYFQSPGAILLVMVGLALFAAAMGLLISAVAKTHGQVIMFSLIVMMVLSSMGGAQFPLEITGAGFSKVGSLMPTYWAMRGFQNIILRGQGIASVLQPVAALCGAAVVVFGLAVWRFKFE